MVVIKLNVLFTLDVIIAKYIYKKILIFILLYLKNDQLLYIIVSVYVEGGIALITKIMYFKFVFQKKLFIK